MDRDPRRGDQGVDHPGTARARRARLRAVARLAEVAPITVSRALRQPEKVSRHVRVRIDAAIARLTDGSYGRCITCGAKIPKSRLDAIPYAAHCVRCASEQEGSASNASITSRRRVLPR